MDDMQALNTNRLDPSKPLQWACGMTTVPSRIASGLTQQTLRSLALAGFPLPRVFVDGAYSRSPVNDMDDGWPNTLEGGQGVGTLQVTSRTPSLRTWGNFVLGLWELWVRHPEADLYAMFQDDFVCVRNLRPYLDRTPWPARGYLNLLTWPQCEDVAPLSPPHFPLNNPRPVKMVNERVVGFFHPHDHCGGRKIGKGLGAVALVFDRDAVVALLTSEHCVTRSESTLVAAGSRGAWQMGQQSIDGGIVTALEKQGIREYVHWPSPVQHVGIPECGHESTMQKRPHPQSKSFPGENFDAMGWLWGAEKVSAEK